MNPWICVLIATVSLAGCQRDTSAPLTAAEQASIRAEIDKLRARYETGVASGTAEALTPLLAQGAVMVQPGAPDWNAMAAAAKGAPETWRSSR